MEQACQGLDGRYYEYPLCKIVHCMAINYDVFEQAGALKYLDLENHTWTTEDFRQACRSIAKSGLVETPGLIYCGGQGGDQGTRALVTNLFGASFTDEENTRYTIDSSEGSEALDFLVDMTREGSLAYDATIQAIDELALFASEKIAMTFAWNSSHARTYTPDAKFNMFPMAFPTDGNQPELCSGIWGFGIFNNGNEAKIENSKKLIDFLCNDEEQAPKSVQATGFFPVRSSLDGIYEGTQFETLMDLFAELTKFAEPYYNITPGWALQRTAWWSMLQKVFSGTESVKALSEYSEIVNGAKDNIKDTPGKTQNNINSRVLFISSNSFNYPDINEQIDGIREGLGDEAFLHCEFMDSTSISGDEFTEKFYRYICDKYEKIGNIGTIIVGGDDALKMVIRYQSGFFSGIPIIYEGINSTSLVELAESLGMKGVYVSNTIIDNFDLACRLKPDLKNIYVISDNSYTGKALSAYIKGIKSRYAPREIVVIDTSMYSNSEIKNILSSIAEDSLVLYMTFTTDLEGNTYRYDHAVKMVTQNVKVPVLSLTWMDNDTLGSISIDYKIIGKEVGLLANYELGIITPEEAEKAKLGEVKGNYTMSSFDAQVMKKFKTSKSLLPQGTIYYNDFSMLEILAYVIVGLAIAVVIFALLSLFYRTDNRRRRVIERQLRNKNKEIAKESESDALTGLGNRRLFDRDIQKSLNSGRTFSLFLIDLDKFKNINDSYGHLVGDAILRETGNRLLSMKERAFVPYRYGGDEFAVLYFHSDTDDVSDKLEKTLSLFSTPIDTEAGKINVNISIGSADFPKNASTVEELVQSADKALYYVKENGRSATKRYTDVVLP